MKKPFSFYNAILEQAPSQIAPTLLPGQNIPVSPPKKQKSYSEKLEILFDYYSNKIGESGTVLQDFLKSKQASEDDIATWRNEVASIVNAHDMKVASKFSSKVKIARKQPNSVMA